jgi:hypothetical protein
MPTEIRITLPLVPGDLSVVAMLATLAGATAAIAEPATAFPADPTLAPASPENSTIVIMGGLVAGRPYLVDGSGGIWTLAAVNGIGAARIGDTPVVGGGAAGGINQLIVRQGQVWCVLAGGQTQYWNAQQGSLYNGVMPPPFTAASGGTAAPVPALVPLPAPPVGNQVPGSSGKVISVFAGGSIATAIANATDGDTVKVAAGTYTAGLPMAKIGVALLLDLSAGAVLDYSAVPYASLAGGGMGALVPKKPFKLLGGRITGVGMKETAASNCCAVRHDAGCGYVWIDGTEIDHNQSGVGGAEVGRTQVNVANSNLHDNGLGDGFTHNIYTGADVDLNLTNVESTTPNGGHAVKHRGPVFSWNGGAGDATDATVIDLSNGTATQAKIANVALTKPATSANHGVVGYAMEGAVNGLAGIAMAGGSVAALCPSPLWQGTGGTLTISDVTLTGNLITAAGGIVVTGT